MKRKIKEEKLKGANVMHRVDIKKTVTEEQKF